MKEIQEWLGHSDFSTTANIYSHLRSDTKVSPAASMMATLGMASSKKEETASEDTTSSET